MNTKLRLCRLNIELGSLFFQDTPKKQVVINLINPTWHVGIQPVMSRKARARFQASLGGKVDLRRGKGSFKVLKVPQGELDVLLRLQSQLDSALDAFYQKYSPVAEAAQKAKMED